MRMWMVSALALVLLPVSPAAAQISNAAALQIVHSAQREAGGSEALVGNPSGIAALLRVIAQRLNAVDPRPDHFGVLVKTSGNQCAGYSCDIVCSGTGGSQRQWDVLIAVGDPGGSRPTWHAIGEGIAVRPCEVVPATSAPPVPNPPPAPEPAPTPPDDRTIEELRARVTVLERLVRELTLEAADIRNVIAAETTDIRAIIADLPVGVPYKGRWSFITIESFPCPECRK